MSFKIYLRFLLAIGLAIGFFSLQITGQAIDGALTVDTVFDSHDPAYQVCSSEPDDCSLRGAISKANADSSTIHDIIIPQGIYTLTLEGSDENSNATGDLDVLVSLNLVGAGADQTIIQAGVSVSGGIDRVLEIILIENQLEVHISDLTIQHGKIPASESGAGMRFDGVGSSLYLDRVMLRNNLGEGYSYGGGLSVNGNLWVVDSTFTGNEAGEGGGIYQMGDGMVYMDRTTIYNNTAEYGGGFMNNSLATLVNVTISGNTATSSGGGISQWNNADLMVHYSTITGNINTGSNSGWAIYSPLQIEVYNSIITAAAGKSACSHSLDGGGDNLGSDGSCGTSILVGDPLLGPLQDNGGHTWTHTIGLGSLAVDAAGMVDNAIPCPSEDQTIWIRPIDSDLDGIASCDIGSYERRASVHLPIIFSQ